MIQTIIIEENTTPITANYHNNHKLPQNSNKKIFFCRIVALIFNKLISELSDMKSDIYSYSVPLSERKCIFSEKQKSRKYAV